MNVNNLGCGAAGILPYTVHNSQIYFLLGYETRGFSDFGGYKDNINESNALAASREFSEETLGLFCKTKEYRGNINGAIESTFIFEKLLKDDNLYTNRIVEKIFNRDNKYEMFICPVDRFLTSDEFKYAYECNKSYTKEQRIDCAEKRGIWWFSIDSILNAIEFDTCEIKSRGRIYKLFGSFFKTLKGFNCLQFIKTLKLLYSNDTKLLEEMIQNIYSSQDLLNGSENLDYINLLSIAIEKEQLEQLSNIPVHSNIQKLQKSLFNNFNK